MTRILSYISKLKIWPFVFIFTSLATLLAIGVIVLESYWLTGGFFDSNLMTVALITPLFVGGPILYFLAHIIRYLVSIQESLRKIEEELTKSNKRLSDAQEIAHMGFWEFDIETDKLFWSDEVYRIFGLKPQEFEATFEGFMNYVHPDDREALGQEYKRSLEEKSFYHIVHRTLRKDGTVRFVDERCEHTYDTNGKAIRSVGIVFDITDRIADEQKLQRLFDLQKNIVIQTDGKSLKKANLSFLHFFGYDALEDFLKEHDCICDLFEEDAKFFHLKKVGEQENWIVALELLPKKERVVSIASRQGQRHIFSVSVNRFDDDDFIVSFTDISETMEEQMSLQQRVSRDQLTGAYSRDFFQTHIHDIIENAKKRKMSLGLVMLDIDHFKRVNDTFGHDVGDVVLTHLVAAVKYSIRSTDLLIRWGGEEFLLIIEAESMEALGRMAEHVRQRVETEPFDRVEHVTCSFGIVLHDVNETIDRSIKRADVALYEAKEGGRNKVVWAEE
ncbi:MAG: diguanylate cyclase [Helicobacteraceae bacterium]|jgi:diguanylate cyclase (GGDEF)-like protein/PAS domain S-box-containing protein|nr:diguanylate cyclase [Helicobacteraceae bacterium]